jgi:hypothetical protein
MENSFKIKSIIQCTLMYNANKVKLTRARPTQINRIFNFEIILFLISCLNKPLKPLLSDPCVMV